MCNTISKAISNLSHLRTRFHELQIQEMGRVYAVCSNVETRFGCNHLVMRDVVRSKKAVLQLAMSYEWKKARHRNAGMLKVNAALDPLDGKLSLWDTCERIAGLFDPVIDAIHLFESDKAMLSQVHYSISAVAEHAQAFATKYPLLCQGSIPLRKNGIDKTATPVTLHASIHKDCMFVYRPAMLAAYVLDPLNWVLRGKQYMTPLDFLSDDQVE